MLCRQTKNSTESSVCDRTQFKGKVEVSRSCWLKHSFYGQCKERWSRRFKHAREPSYCRRKELWWEILRSEDRLLQLKNKLAYVRWLDFLSQKAVCDKRKSSEWDCPGAFFFSRPTEKVVDNHFAGMTYCEGETTNSSWKVVTFNCVPIHKMGYAELGTSRIHRELFYRWTQITSR